MPVLFLRRVRKIAKRTISFVLSVCPSVRMEQLGSHWTDFREICYLGTFRKSFGESSSFVKIQQQ
jgi:hypothetical protein